MNDDFSLTSDLLRQDEKPDTGNATFQTVLAATDENNALLFNVDKNPPIDREMEQKIKELSDAGDTRKVIIFKERLERLRSTRLLLLTYTKSCTNMLTK